jgi:hypothetical protein
MHNPILAPTATAGFRSLVLAASASALVFACSSSSQPPSDGQDPTTAGGTTTGAGGSSSSTTTSMTTTTSGTGGNVSESGGAAGTDGSGGSSAVAGTMAMGGTGGTMTAGGSGGSGPIGGPTIMYTVSGYNNASWGGGDAAGVIKVNGSGYLPMAMSDCPKDPDMAIVAPYKDKIFNGCLDECFGDTNMAGHGIATVLDWETKSGGWAVAQIYSNLHHTGMWAPTTGPNPVALVFWIKGANGNEQNNFTVAIHTHDDKLSTALKLPITVTQAWQRVVIPWDSFKVPGSAYPDGMVFSATAAGKVTVFIDQAYLSKTVKIP